MADLKEIPHITGHTQLVGLVATPIRHSLSPEMHTASFAHMGEDIVYLCFEVGPDELEAAHKGMQAMGFLGYNVSMPNKTLIGQSLDELTPAAELMGAVNCVDLHTGKAVGHNTDGAGFWRNVTEHGIDVKGKKITLVGAGGAGSAVFTQAALDGVAEIDVFNIKDDFFAAAEERCAALTERTGAKVTMHDLADKDDLAKSVSESVMFINASRVGMAPDVDGCTLPEELMREDLVVADTVYNPLETKMIRTAKEHGCTVVPGLGMMMWQAAIGEEIWTGKTMDIDYIESLFF